MRVFNLVEKVLSLGTSDVSTSADAGSVSFRSTVGLLVSSASGPVLIAGPMFTQSVGKSLNSLLPENVPSDASSGTTFGCHSSADLTGSTASLRPRYSGSSFAMPTDNSADTINVFVSASENFVCEGDTSESKSYCTTGEPASDNFVFQSESPASDGFSVNADYGSELIAHQCIPYGFLRNGADYSSEDYSHYGSEILAHHPDYPDEPYMVCRPLYASVSSGSEHTNSLSPPWSSSDHYLAGATHDSDSSPERHPEYNEPPYTNTMYLADQAAPYPPPYPSPLSGSEYSDLLPPSPQTHYSSYSSSADQAYRPIYASPLSEWEYSGSLPPSSHIGYSSSEHCADPTCDEP